MTRSRILIGDDEPDICFMLKTALESYEFETETAMDGDEVIAKINTFRPNLLLLDVMMPKKSGYEVLGIIRSNKKTSEIPVIMLTGKADVPDKIAGFQLGATDYLTKPFEFSELIARINVHLQTQKGLEKKIKTEKLVALSKMMDGFAHEVRNPLVVIGGFAKLLLKTIPPDNPCHKYTDIIIKEVYRLERMIEDVYRFKTTVINKTNMHSINNVVFEAISDAVKKYSKHSINLIFCPCDKDKEILMDKEQFKIGLDNIIKNAVEASHKGADVNIKTTNVGNQFHISIEDKGTGIKEEQLGYVFDPFFTTKMEGAGLGLSIALKIFQEHGGNITIISTEGKGTEVIIEIP